MEYIETDMVVIGAGPAGQKAAIQAAKLGREVIVVDRGYRLGGACLNHGTIPSKTLREAVLELTGYRERSFYGRLEAAAEVSIRDLNFRLDVVLEQLGMLVTEQLRDNGVRVFQGSGKFLAIDTLEVSDADGEATHRIRAGRFLIATGSSPRHPDHVPFDDDCILDSDRLLRMERVPESLLVLGGGIIGSEYATMMAALGCRVTLIDRVERPLRAVDGEIAVRFMDYLDEMGIDLQLGRKVEDIQRNARGRAEVTLDCGDVLEADCAFCAMGRVANVAGLDLDCIGLELTGRGVLPVNPLFQTAWPNIFAAGDVIGGASLASTAMEQGRLAARNAFAERAHPFPDLFPFGIYTIPEIAFTGPTEEQLQADGIHYRTGRAHYAEIARGAIAGDRKGMIKLIFHDETRELLASHIIGTGATELIHIVQAAIHFRAKVDYFVDQVFNYPTFAEGFRIAALNGLNKGREPVAPLVGAAG